MTDAQVTVAVTAATVVLEVELRRLRPAEVPLPMGDVVTLETTGETTVDDLGPPLVVMTDDDRGRLWVVDGAVEARRRMATLMRLMPSELMMPSMTMSGVRPAAMRETSRRFPVVFLDRSFSV